MADFTLKPWARNIFNEPLLWAILIDSVDYILWAAQLNNITSMVLNLIQWMLIAVVFEHPEAFLFQIFETGASFVPGIDTPIEYIPSATLSYLILRTGKKETVTKSMGLLMVRRK